MSERSCSVSSRPRHAARLADLPVRRTLAIDATGQDWTGGALPPSQPRVDRLRTPHGNDDVLPPMRLPTRRRGRCLLAVGLGPLLDQPGYRPSLLLTDRAARVDA